MELVVIRRIREIRWDAGVEPCLPPLRRRDVDIADSFPNRDWDSLGDLRHREGFGTCHVVALPWRLPLRRISNATLATPSWSTDANLTSSSGSKSALGVMIGGASRKYTWLSFSWLSNGLVSHDGLFISGGRVLCAVWLEGCLEALHRQSCLSEFQGSLSFLPPPVDRTLRTMGDEHQVTVDRFEARLFQSMPIWSRRGSASSLVTRRSAFQTAEHSARESTRSGSHSRRSSSRTVTDHYGGLTSLLDGTDVPVYAVAGVDEVIRRDDPAKEQILRPMFGEEWAFTRTFPNRLPIPSGDPGLPAQ
jgi:hypothetical protein